MTQLRVAIDADACRGHGRCYGLAGELFADDEAGYGVVRDDGAVAPALEPLARRIVGICPEAAITLTDQ